MDSKNVSAANSASYLPPPAPPVPTATPQAVAPVPPVVPPQAMPVEDPTTKLNVMIAELRAENETIKTQLADMNNRANTLMVQLTEATNKLGISVEARKGLTDMFDAVLNVSVKRN